MKKGEVTKVPVWVKLHGVHVLAYSEDGLSLIATQIGKPIMLDAFTSSMCADSWGRISFSRALIEVSSDSALKSEAIMGIPNEKGDGYIKQVIRVEYEWSPPQCTDCKKIWHCTSQCPKRVMSDGLKSTPMAPKPRSDMDNDEGFVEVKRRKNKKKAGPNRNISGINLSKCKPNVQYRPVSRQGKDNDDASKTAANGQKKGSLDLKNSFDTLMENDNNLEEGDVGSSQNVDGVDKNEILRT
ncbi:putative reverse transcriptase domain-containing protein [Tanacetum coccineum]